MDVQRVFFDHQRDLWMIIGPVGFDAQIGMRLGMLLADISRMGHRRQGHRCHRFDLGHMFGQFPVMVMILVSGRFDLFGRLRLFADLDAEGGFLRYDGDLFLHRI